jgi:hypothetical protein
MRGQPRDHWPIKRDHGEGDNVGSSTHATDQRLTKRSRGWLLAIEIRGCKSHESHPRAGGQTSEKNSLLREVASIPIGRKAQHIGMK